MIEIFSNQLNIPTADLSPGSVYTINLTGVQDASRCSGVAEGTATLHIQASTIIEAGVSQNICNAKPLDLQTLGAFMLQNGQPFTTGEWNIIETDSDGVFMDENGNNLGHTAGFTTAKYLRAGANDVKRGYLTLALRTAFAEGTCTSEEDTVRIKISKAECGNFPWDGEK